MRAESIVEFAVFADEKIHSVFHDSSSLIIQPNKRRVKVSPRMRNIFQPEWDSYESAATRHLAEGQLEG